jgi:hypothetical protein
VNKPHDVILHTFQFKNKGEDDPLHIKGKGGKEVKLQAFYTLTPNGVDGSALCSGRITLGEVSFMHTVQIWLGWSHS